MAQQFIRCKLCVPTVRLEGGGGLVRRDPTKVAKGGGDSVDLLLLFRRRVLQCSHCVEGGPLVIRERSGGLITRDDARTLHHSDEQADVLLLFGRQRRLLARLLARLRLSLEQFVHCCFEIPIVCLEGSFRGLPRGGRDYLDDRVDANPQHRALLLTLLLLTQHV